MFIVTEYAALRLDCICCFIMLTFCFVVFQLFLGLDKQSFERKIVNIFLPISLNMCFGCSKEPSH